MELSGETIAAILVAVFASPWVGEILKEKFSKTSNKAILEKMDANQKANEAKQDETDYKIDKNQALLNRARILRFNGELRRGVRHDEEEFDDVLMAIDDYESFCKEHPEFPNSKAVAAIANIRRVYTDCMQENDFL